jgi:hypothetical protein
VAPDSGFDNGSVFLLRALVVEMAMRHLLIDILTCRPGYRISHLDIIGLLGTRATPVRMGAGLLDQYISAMDTGLEAFY